MIKERPCERVRAQSFLEDWVLVSKINFMFVVVEANDTQSKNIADLLLGLIMVI